MTSGAATILVRWFILLVTVIAPLQTAQAIEHFEIDIHRDTSLLPYAFEPVLRNDEDPDRISINALCRILTVAQDSTRKGIAITVYNGKKSVGEAAVFSTLATPDFTGDDKRIGLTVNDWAFFRDSVIHRVIVCGCGYDGSAAWVFRLDLQTGKSQKLFLISTIDSTGKGVCATPTIHLVSDYDFDGNTEMIVYFDEGAGRRPRVLFCVELEAMKVQWSLPMASELIENRTHDCRDSLNPAIMVVTNPSGQGVTDSAFSDSYGYLVKIDEKGTILRKRIIACVPTLTFFVRGETPGQYYLRHNFGPDDPDSLLGKLEDHYYLSKIDNNANFIKSVRLREYGTSLWLQPFDTLSTAIYIPQQDDVIGVYNTDLTLIAESNRLDKVKSPSAILGRIRLPGQQDTSFVLNTGFFTRDWKQLFAFPFPAGSCEVAVIDTGGAASRIVVCGGNKYVYGEIRRRSFRELATIFYVNNQKYILMVLSALLVSVILITYNRQRTKRSLVVITQQKLAIEHATQEITQKNRQLEDTNRDLQKAYNDLQTAGEQLALQRAQRAAAEQYRAASGQFRHEINNALGAVKVFITNSIQGVAGGGHGKKYQLNRMRLAEELNAAFAQSPTISEATRAEIMSALSKIDDLQTKLLEDLEKVVLRGVNRGLDLADRLRKYERIDYDDTQQPVDLAVIVREVTIEREDDLAQGGIGVKTEFASDCTLSGSPELFGIMFRNLLDNSIDALDGLPNDRKRISISAGKVELGLEIIWHDTGCGIKPESREKIFQPFYTEKPRTGSGLGLSMVQSIVGKYRGQIRVESVEGEYTDFVLVFPI